MNKTALPLALLAIALRATDPADMTAAQFDVHLWSNSGPDITGVVDTTTDQFIISSWRDTSTNQLFWTPQSGELPITLRAYSFEGGTYDVPDDWSGTISNWAFVLPEGTDTTSMLWEQGTVSSFWRGTSFGWGGCRVCPCQTNVCFVGAIGGLGGNGEFQYIPCLTDSMCDMSLSGVTIVPRSPALQLSVGVSQVRLCWTSQVGKRYQLQHCSELTTNHWIDLGTPIQGNGNTNVITHEVATPCRFYRLLLLP
jgi:hypothetical protein